jgi:hypothetical protein
VGMRVCGVRDAARNGGVSFVRRDAMGEGWMAKKWMLTLALLVAVGMAAFLASCSQGDAVTAAKTIHAYLPVVMGLANEAAAITGALDPAETLRVQAVSGRVQAELGELETLSGAYAAAPTADGWLRLEAVVDALVSDADEALLAAVAIKNPANQGKAKVALSALDAAMHVVDGYLMTARTPAEAKAAADQRAVKLQSVVRYWRPEDRRSVELAFGAHFEDLSGAAIRRGF